MTCHDRSAELGTRNFVPKPRFRSNSLRVSATVPDNRRIHSPCYPETPSPRPNSMTILPMTHPLDHFPSPLRLPMTRLISTLCPLCTTRPLTAEEKALESYCDDDDTVEFTVVDGTAIQSSPPQCAYRAHNPTDPSLSSTSLSVQHPVPIKLEDLPSSLTLIVLMLVKIITPQ
ncbi:hypothetical protein MHU86_16829 [Fragilaria crotonensis]|nr:hypothetical protein MHU86_16829 [Fragilaria crotonensis]